MGDAAAVSVPASASVSVPELELREVSKRFGTTAAVERVSFRLGKGEFLALLGPSGCGKTTTLRMIAGFLVPDEGRILLRGRDVTDDPPYRRDVGLVFQSYALFPHMTVAENVGFGLRMRREPKAVVRDRVRWALDLVRLAGLEERRPAQLSGGQQQRVAVARVLAAGASLLLFDEPFSNLDARLRKAMQVELRDLQQRLGIAAVHVTHDQEEAMSLSDRLIIMDRGRIAQEGTPVEIYREPRNAFVADFMGDVNRLPGRVTGPLAPGTVEFVADGGARLEVTPRGGTVPAGPAVAVVRPEHVGVAPAGSLHGRPNVLRGTVRRSVYLGPMTTVCVTVDAAVELRVQLVNGPEATGGLPPGMEVDLHIPAASVSLIAP